LTPELTFFADRRSGGSPSFGPTPIGQPIHAVAVRAGSADPAQLGMMDISQTMALPLLTALEQEAVAAGEAGPAERAVREPLAAGLSLTAGPQFLGAVATDGFDDGGDDAAGGGLCASMMDCAPSR
jgi:hypothetical protein